MKKILSVVFVIIWMLLIFFLSNQDSLESTESTNIVYKIFNINTDSLFIFTLIRKCAHFIEYLILGLLVYNMFKNYKISNIFICTILFCIICSIFDEIHQLFIPGREGKIIDCLIDTVGSSIGLLFIILKQKFNKRLSKN